VNKTSVNEVCLLLTAFLSVAVNRRLL